MTIGNNFKHVVGAFACLPVSSQEQRQPPTRGLREAFKESLGGVSTPSSL